MDIELVDYKELCKEVFGEAPETGEVEPISTEDAVELLENAE